MSGDYYYVGILIGITLLQNGKLPTLVEETLLSPPADACALELQRGLEMLGMLSAFKVFVSLYYDRTIFYLMKNISRTSELPVRSCENRQFPL